MHEPIITNCKVVIPFCKDVYLTAKYGNILAKDLNSTIAKTLKAIGDELKPDQPIKAISSDEDDVFK